VIVNIIHSYVFVCVCLFLYIENNTFTLLYMNSALSVWNLYACIVILWVY